MTSHAARHVTRLQVPLAWPGPGASPLRPIVLPTTQFCCTLAARLSAAAAAADGGGGGGKTDERSTSWRQQQSLISSGRTLTGGRLAARSCLYGARQHGSSVVV